MLPQEFSSELKTLFDRVNILKSATDKYTGQEAIDKYALILTFNHFVSSRKQVGIGQFNQRRTKLNEEQIVQAINMSKKIIDVLERAQNVYLTNIKEQKRLQDTKKLQDVKQQTVIIDHKEVMLKDLIGKDGEITNSSIADYIIHVYNPFSYEGNPYYYSDGIYILDNSDKLGKSKLSQIIDEIIEQVYPLKKLENKRLRIMSEIQTLIMMRNRLERNPFDQYNDMICCGNGIIKFYWNTKTFELLPYSPQYIFRVKHAFCIDKTITTMEVETWLKELSTSYETKEVNCSTYDKLIEAPAAALVMQLTRGTFKASYLALGYKDSAKTTYCEEFLKKRFFGIHACSGTSMKSLCDDRFGKDSIIGKSVNICDDLTDTIVNYAQEWKKLTGGAFIEVELKFKNKINVLFPMSIFSANEFPKLNIKEDSAFWSRWNVIEFKNKFERDIYYAETLDKYISPFALLVIKKVFELYDTKTLKNDEFNKQLIQNWNRDNDSFESFLYKFVEFDSFGYVQSAYLYQLYNDYCDEMSFTIRKLASMFNEEVIKLVSPNNKYTVKQQQIELTDDTTPNVYIGIRLKSSMPENLVIDVKPDSDAQQPTLRLLKKFIK